MWLDLIASPVAVPRIFREKRRTSPVRRYEIIDLPVSLFPNSLKTTLSPKMLLPVSYNSVFLEFIN